MHADMETNECLENNGGCWQDKAANVTACKVASYIYIYTYIPIYVLSISLKFDHTFCAN